MNESQEEAGNDTGDGTATGAAAGTDAGSAAAGAVIDQGVLTDVSAAVSPETVMLFFFVGFFVPSCVGLNAGVRFPASCFFV